MVFDGVDQVRKYSSAKPKSQLANSDLPQSHEMDLERDLHAFGYSLPSRPSSLTREMVGESWAQRSISGQINFYQPKCLGQGGP